MKQIETWQRPKTSRVYLHPYGSERLVMIQPDMKIVDLDLRYNGWHYNLPGFGAHLVFGKEPGDADMELTEWKKPEDGLPIYTLYNVDPDNGCKIRMTAFCDTNRKPATYCEVQITNPHNETASGTESVCPHRRRSADCQRPERVRCASDPLLR